MRAAFLLICLWLGGSCSSSGTRAAASLEYLRCPTSSPSDVTADTGWSAADVSIFGAYATPNRHNCSLDPSICATLGSNFSCDPALGCCKEADLGRCVRATDCMDPQFAICDLAANICTPCATTNLSLGDQQCRSWAATQMNSASRTLCFSGACVECRNGNDCTNPSKTVCDANDHTCKGCVANSDCPGSGICKTAPILLAAGETRLNLGECVKPADVAFVDNLAGGCDSTGAAGKPFCEITQALTSGKPYVRVKGNGGTIGSLYKPVTVGGGRQVVILGPGRDVPLVTQQAVIDSVTVNGGAQLTLMGISVTNSMGQPAVQCVSESTLHAHDVLISDVVVTPKGGIYANACKVDIQRTKIVGAFGYGLSLINGKDHVVINNAFTNGGNGADQFGLRIAGSATGLFAFNTIVNNRQGVLCDSPVTITDSIVTANVSTQVVGACTQVRVVTGNVDLDPAYQSGGDPRLTSHAMNDECCVDKGMPDPGMIVKDDYQPVKRPFGKGYDIGFHEAR